MKKILTILGLCLGLTTIAIAEEKEKEIKIGITQIVEHPSLDAARKGIEKALKDKASNKKIKIDYQTAQGDFGTAQLITKSFVSSKKDIIVTISTPSAQAALNATKNIPIVYTAVTDGASAGLKGANITGTSDMSPLDKEISLIKDMLPKAKKVGFIYNTSEQNSVILLKKFKNLAKSKNLVVVEKGVSSVNDINLALDTLLNQIDVLFIPTDNLVYSSASLVLQKANRKNVPIIASTKDIVEKGALATESIDYEKLGYQTGEVIIKIMNGKNPKDIPVETLKETNLIINKKMAKKYNVNIDDIKYKKAEKI